jgi:hypothetical protein
MLRKKASAAPKKTQHKPDPMVEVRGIVASLTPANQSDTVVWIMTADQKAALEKACGR